MHTLARLLAITAGLLVCVGVTLPAQWRVQTKGVPMTPAGAPNLEAPAPKLSDGRTPDLSGIWAAEKVPCDEAKAPLGCIDVQLGIPPGFVNIATGIGGPDPNDPTPFQPWARALVRQRMADFSTDDPRARCLPEAGPRMWASLQMQKIIHDRGQPDDPAGVHGAVAANLSGRPDLADRSRAELQGVFRREVGGGHAGR